MEKWNVESVGTFGPHRLILMSLEGVPLISSRHTRFSNETPSSRSPTPRRLEGRLRRKEFLGG